MRIHSWCLQWRQIASTFSRLQSRGSGGVQHPTTALSRAHRCISQTLIRRLSHEGALRDARMQGVPSCHPYSSLIHSTGHQARRCKRVFENGVMLCAACGRVAAREWATRKRKHTDDATASGRHIGVQRELYCAVCCGGVEFIGSHRLGKIEHDHKHRHVVGGFAHVEAWC